MIDQTGGSGKGLADPARMGIVLRSVVFDELKWRCRRLSLGRSLLGFCTTMQMAALLIQVVSRVGKLWRKRRDVSVIRISVGCMPGRIMPVIAETMMTDVMVARGDMQPSRCMAKQQRDAEQESREWTDRRDHCSPKRETIETEMEVRPKTQSRIRYGVATGSTSSKNCSLS
ncbi:hypothetical protein RE6C_01309 [Rhodopirellula europaea 6C]|uniref:Uncharacterized protein n=1 Tax=Rhodopirellula europaea 6C TaxID=1263867 RepID=M2A8A7_9BACT|nr:hypothetical protein RE6C_01309 [Rhodopirellula europaea 6C]